VIDIPTKFGALIIAVASAAAAQSSMALTAEPIQVRMSDGSKLDTELDTLTVPELRGLPGGRQIPLRFVRLRSTAANPGHPIVYLAGGPGSSGISDLQGPRGAMLQRLRSVADVIVLDQRGTGKSNSIPACQPSETLDPMKLTEGEIMGYMHRQFGRCLTLWRDAGVDPRGYTLAESARDLEGIRLALGAPKLDLLGISYGPQLGMAYIKLFPNKTGRAVFASGRGLDQTVRMPAELDAFLTRVGGPKLVPLMRRVHARLDAHPATVTITSDKAPGPVTMRFDSFPIRYVASFFFMNDAAGAERLPELYRKMDAGDYSAFAEVIYARCLDPRQGRFTAYRGMGEIMDLSSNWSRERRRRWLAQNASSALGDAHNFPMPQGLGIDATLDIPPNLKVPLKSNVPALFISGTHDGRLPLESQAVTMRGFRHGQQIVVERGGHNIFEQSKEVQDAVVRFLRDGTVATHRIAVR